MRKYFGVLGLIVLAVLFSAFKVSRGITTWISRIARVTARIARDTAAIFSLSSEQETAMRHLGLRIVIGCFAYTVLLTACLPVFSQVAGNTDVSVQALIQRISELRRSVKSGRARYQLEIVRTRPDASVPLATQPIEVRFRGEDEWLSVEALNGVESGDGVKLTEAILGGKYSYRLDRPTPTEPTMRGEVVTDSAPSARRGAADSYFTPRAVMGLQVMSGGPVEELLAKGANFVFEDNGQTVLSHWDSGRNAENFDIYFDPEGRVERVLSCSRFDYADPAALSRQTGLPVDRAIQYRVPMCDTYYHNFVESGGVYFPCQIISKSYHLSQVPGIDAVKSKIDRGESTWQGMAQEIIELFHAASPQVVKTAT